MTLRIIKFICIVTLVLAALGAGCQRATAPQQTASNVPQPVSSYTTKLQVGQTNLLVDVAATEQARQQGLSGRSGLTDNQGMLFDFGDVGASQPGFWMKDMKFDLDLIWIYHGQVIDVTSNVPAPATSDAPLPVYRPPSPIDMVLEVRAGWAAAHNIKVGDEVTKF